MRWMLSVIGIVGLACAAASAAQTVPGRADAPLPPPAGAGAEGQAISAGQNQRWFEAYTVLQAQDALGLTEAQYGRFVTRLKLLQEVRRKHQQSRNRILADLR